MAKGNDLRPHLESVAGWKIEPSKRLFVESNREGDPTVSLGKTERAICVRCPAAHFSSPHLFLSRLSLHWISTCRAKGRALPLMGWKITLRHSFRLCFTVSTTIKSPRWVLSAIWPCTMAGHIDVWDCCSRSMADASRFMRWRTKVALRRLTMWRKKMSWPQRQGQQSVVERWWKSSFLGNADLLPIVCLLLIGAGRYDSTRRSGWD